MENWGNQAKALERGDGALVMIPESDMWESQS